LLGVGAGTVCCDGSANPGGDEEQHRRKGEGAENEKGKLVHALMIQQRVEQALMTMLERITAASGVGLRLHAEKKPNFEREVALV